MLRRASSALGVGSVSWSPHIPAQILGVADLPSDSVAFFIASAPSLLETEQWALEPAEALPTHEESSALPPRLSNRMPVIGNPDSAKKRSTPTHPHSPGERGSIQIVGAEHRCNCQAAQSIQRCKAPLHPRQQALLRLQRTLLSALLLATSVLLVIPIAPASGGSNLT
jgi:hypothetical protein